MTDAAWIELPAWAVVSERRIEHIGRVTALMMRWADDLGLAADERAAWRDAGLWHDALRDAPEATLRELCSDTEHPLPMLHGPAAAQRLRAIGERRATVLDAVAWHTMGHAEWDRTGRALYMADYLEPGRDFARADRAFLATHVAHDFDGVFRQVVRQRIEWSVREGKTLYPETASLWNRVR